MDLATKATENQGSAMANQEKYMESYEGKLQGLKTAVDTLWIHLLDEEGFKTIMDWGTDLIKLIDGLTSKIGLIPTAAGLFGGLGLSKSGLD